MLKEFQKQVMSEVRTFLDLLVEERDAGVNHPSLDSWSKFRVGRSLDAYKEKANPLGKDVPNFCIKVPTGGGKTLLATQILGEAYETTHQGRNGVGLVIWIVPSDQIYKDTLKALQDRRHFYREGLEFALSSPVEVWEKQDINRLSPVGMRDKLNILLLKLQSANRLDRDVLKLFQDTGGNIVQHFPPEDDSDSNRRLFEAYPNLDMIASDPLTGEYLARTSVINLCRIAEPVIILDEGHRAYSEQAKSTLLELNPSLIVELSATPSKEHSNILCRVTGKALLDEDMIKLPMNIDAARISEWEKCLELAVAKRNELERLSLGQQDKTGRYLRPIALIQAERTGREQRGPDHVHSEDVKESLIRLGVPKEQIAEKSSVVDELDGKDLLSDECPIRYIVTKSALQEGWDCSFAYVLVVLNPSRSNRAMTQLVGRILRQPDQRRFLDEEALNESYIFCRERSAAEIVADVKKGLEQEGLEDISGSAVRGGGAAPIEYKLTSYQEKFREFEGKVYLPRFCVRNADGSTEKFDYFVNLLSAIQVDDFDYNSETWNAELNLEAAQHERARLTLGEEASFGDRNEELLEEADELIESWVASSLEMTYFDYRQTNRVVHAYSDRVRALNPAIAGSLYLVRYALRERLREFIRQQTSRLAKSRFDTLIDQGVIGFYMECAACKFKLPSQIRVRAKEERLAVRTAPPKSLFDYADGSMNDFEEAVAICMEKQPEVLWWYRNHVGPNQFYIEGYEPPRIYPDFIAHSEAALNTVWVIESKGSHLKDTEDTDYKRNMADYFDRLGKQVTWEELGSGFKDGVFRFQVLDQGKSHYEWEADLKKRLSAS